MKALARNAEWIQQIDRENDMKKIVFILLLFAVQYTLYAQVCALSGTVKDAETGEPIKGATVSLLNTNIGEITDSLGQFRFCHLNDKEYVLSVNYIGYESDTTHLDLSGEHILDIRLKPSSISLREVTVTTSYSRSTLLDKPKTSFAEMLNAIPGAVTQNIGAGAAKPIIRGLGYNRVAVINRGIIQHNQQWGADHGMEINQFDMGSATIYKGPDALLLGSASMSAVEIEPFRFKEKDFYSGEAILWGASNNDQLGGAFISAWQIGKWYVRGNIGYQDFADYRVPTDKFSYDGEDISLPDKRVPNTAGKALNVSGTVGYRNEKVTSYLNVSNNYTKTGLFELPHHHEEHEHGEGEHDHDHHHEHEDADNSHRNIALPYATSNHFAVTNNTEWKKSSSLRLSVNTGYQNNHRKEMEHFHEHYEGQAAPPEKDDVAVDFKLHTYSTNARLFMDEDSRWKKIIGASMEYQQNRVGGFEFFLPRYNQVLGSLSYVNYFELHDKFYLGAGIRYDISHIDIAGFYDNAMAESLREQGYNPQIVQQYAQRAYDVDRTMNGWSGNIGFNYKANNELLLKLQLAKSFRFPSANELGANGLHHAAFRYEIGDPDMKTEHGYNLDLGVHYNKSGLTIGLSPFVSYYSNFIYLQPVEDSPVVVNDKPYKYSQAKAIYGGGEYEVLWNPFNVIDRIDMELSSGGSLVLSKNKDDHNPLPMTPPFTMNNKAKLYRIIGGRTGITYWQASVSHQWYADQNRVGAGEEKTKGTNLFNIGAGFDYKFNDQWSMLINLQVNNIFDKRYLNHMSLYRRLNIPEQGRNIQLFVRIPFKG